MVALQEPLEPARDGVRCGPRQEPAEGRASAQALSDRAVRQRRLGMSGDVLPGDFGDDPLLHTEETEDAVEGRGRIIHELAVADDVHLLPGEQRKDVLELLPVPAESRVVPERRPAGGDTPFLLPAGLNEIPAGLEPGGDFVQACGEEERRIAAGWASFWHYTGLGRYGEQLEHIFSLFPREQVYVIRYRQLVDNPTSTLDGIFGFLGVEQGVVTEVPRQNVTAHPEATLAHRAVAQGLRAGSAFGRFLPGSTPDAVTGRLERFLQRHHRERQPLSWQQRQELIPRFEADLELLGRVLDADFSDWRAPRDRSGGMVGARPEGQSQARNGRPLRLNS